MLSSFIVNSSIFKSNLINIALAFISSSLFSLIFGSIFLRYSSLFRSKQREFTPENHISKNNTPTMGGLFLISSALVSILIFSNIKDLLVSLSLILLLSFSFIGFVDDRSKILRKRGISEKTKFILQVLFASLISSIWFYFCKPETNIIDFINLNFGYLIIPWAAFIIVGVSNAVNITDGLDGLAAKTLIPNFILFGAIAYLSGSFNLAVISASLAGSCLGFLKYNRFPAKVFMGDIGSLPLGAILGFIALALQQEFLLIISGFIFLAETLSVIIQVIYFKLYKKRFFKMAPIHHHFELLGNNETKITSRFSILTWFLALVSLIIFLIIRV